MGLENDGRLNFEEDRADEAFRVDLDGYEGPLDLLLDLARRQKVDLARISVLALAEQYLRFIEEARRVRLELAADYLVMAAWLAYLKSRLLLPAPPKTEEPDAAALAANLAQRLKRLQKIRAAAELLGERPQLGRDLFARGAPEGVDVVNAPLYQASLYDLLSAYARQRQKQALANVALLKTRTVWSLAEAREALERILGMALEWTALDDFLIQWVARPDQARTVRASTFSATLELVKEGRIDVRQDRTFGPIWLRRKGEPPPVVAAE
ncbi:condensin subunit ScpA [Rhodoblastus acidophilus]|uniref:Segregation and condensation protein A n=1 Tax=Rhodoblastus acidophilus TaxID=1074 RepID=A0A212Q5U9_RHOAC|nr:ScpA family protein [Rhodoblastus acidophilus]MCW2316538.1 segregation and condensation protein A [Rhodoblastus acidophilus]PPQ36344.1 segregation/condensation protein A [Rhodoblastus acidophilus]RAI19731.1 segregation/condensation protein A [Rhodoblastus acidophilus]SNB54725.1 condensin subunit ScpA [Rhodoblastus acidophilus]